MRLKLILLFNFLLNFTFAQSECKNHCAEVIIDKMNFTTCLTIKEKGDKVFITTPKNADVRLLGRTKSILGRLTKKLPKKGVLLKIEGSRNGDLITGNVKVAFMGSFPFRGTFSDVLDIEILNEKEQSFGNIKTISSDPCPNVSYKELHYKMVQKTEEHIFSKSELNNNEYRETQKNLGKIFAKAKDDIELFFGFQMLSSTIPFSHYNLLMIPNLDNGEADTDIKALNTEYKQISDKTAYVKIDNFSTTEKEIMDIFTQLHSKSSVDNLILDLRDNPGGGIEAGYELGRHLMKDKTEIGYFVTNKYHKDTFDKNTFVTFPSSKATTTEGFLEELAEIGGLIMIYENTSNKIFEGQIYVLISDATASTSEPIAYALAQKRNAILVGQTTAGAMLSAKVVDLIGKYRLFMPIGDFYTFDGIRLEGSGVNPTHECDPKEALDFALKLIEGKK